MGPACPRVTTQGTPVGTRRRTGGTEGDQPGTESALPARKTARLAQKGGVGNTNDPNLSPTLVVEWRTPRYGVRHAAVGTRLADSPGCGGVGPGRHKFTAGCSTCPSPSQRAPHD
ncbi:hypothetical protein FRAHR75_20204 [Frankia sp. Hr75.2]|nr:hypothetical protein FRAHR75_20204 [Frankia sp. Hr75.2]SQD97414.1 hypothetical protein FMEAI12_4080001 [Parafrankia sp. Ea1.12]